MAATNYLFDTRDVKFILKEWLDMEKLLSFPAYRDYYSLDDIDAFVDVAYKIARDVVAPVNEDADKIGAQFIDGKVITPDSFKECYQTIMDAGFGPQIADREVEGRLPFAINAPLLEMFIAASAAFPTFWALTQGAAGVIQKHGSDLIKEKFLPKMFSGEWAGCMDLTEPGAGSDVGAATTKAFPTDQAGIYKIKGQKMFITAGDHDLCENHIHLVLARVEGAREGTAGLSLFVVPKYWVDDDGNIGDFNDVTTVGIEEKMGLHGSPTCALAYGENDNCYGYLVGNPPGEDGKGEGLKQMFLMMNEERLGTAMLGLGVASEAYYNAREYARERVQGTKMTDPKGERVHIIEHEDVRRMLMYQKSCVEAIRAMIYKTYYYVDMSRDSDDPAEREFADDMFQMNNPLCKAYATDMAWILIADAIQVYGGYGYIEEYPVAQLARDSKIFSIWEGTNYIQSMDLVGRKFTLKKGRLLKNWLGDISTFIQENKEREGFKQEFKLIEEAFADYSAILGLLKQYLSEGKIQLMPLYSTRILHATSMLYAGSLILDQALLADSKLKELGEDHYDANYYKGKVASARFYIKNVVPKIGFIRKAFEIADTSAIDIGDECFG
ncbi:MAG TPA: acyl-CoA dehydrogenase [Syntrophomonadaceae bacterium]|nr:acyl-CoA dehydrogenase [Syntrophomonadaceae bacterium]